MRRFIALAAFALFATAPVLHAQNNIDWAEPAAPPSEDGSGGLHIDDVNAPPGLPTDPTPVPIDGGLTLLGAAGAAYAVKRLRHRRNAKD